MTERMRLRPVTEPDLDRLEEMFDDPEGIGEYNWGGFGSGRSWRRQWAEDRLIGDRTVLMVALGDETLGFVSWHRVQTGPQVHVLEFGICLWPRWRGRGHGTAAQRLLAAYLFAHHPVNRIQAWTDVDNIPEQRALDKAGFVREAVLREYAWRAGAWRDEVLYRMLRRELP
ncbi:GNAT family N-acetyltransferase [Actinophytocola xanthii]|uniref:N-acetyltransferase domain-containing protein n=1 Tax=Actinophytocola xanthii TaxID=1912961 RepID=A0A1Q8CP41_9PSEU|nr:GNAT family protein [Actinophytocola xanthii]OLF16096.1 hypothetical protein BU204_18250 [Actinophytocola xanthii]